MPLVDVLRVLVAQVGAQGGAIAQKGAIQRLSEPNLYDMVFPLIAFGLVILLPTCTALWVIVRVIKDKNNEVDEV